MAQGRARFVYRHMAFLGDESVAAAAATECAGDQGRWWDYHDRLMAVSGARNSGAFSPAALKGFATELGLKAEPFGACVDAGTHLGRVRAETEQGRQQGVTSTPTIFINGQKMDRGITFVDILNKVNILAPLQAPLQAPQASTR